MDKIRAEKFEQLINLLHEADALQQELLGDVDEAACYEFHTQLNNLADEFECWAAHEEEEYENLEIDLDGGLSAINE